MNAVRRLRTWLAAYGLLNAALYASLLPLWEGFDEPFHYGYVFSLSREWKLPQLGESRLPSDVWESFRLAPASHVVQRNLPWVVTYADYFRMPRDTRAHWRAQLDRLPQPIAGAGGPNYEAHQAPLAYAAMALVEVPCRFAGLMTRVWLLRLFCGLFAVAAMSLCLFSLARRLGLPQPYEGALVFSVLSWQMFYATTAHVANDWLAVPLMAALFDRMLALLQRPSLRNALLLTAALCAGLLTKAYFLALAPIAVAVLAALTLRRLLSWHALAWSGLLMLAAGGPWSLRNLRLYGNLTGMQETAGGADWPGLAAAFLHLPWRRTVTDLLYSSVWTGNNSLSTFSTSAISMLLAGFAVALALYATDAVRRRKLPISEAMMLCGCAAYGAALLYSTTLSFWYSKGAVASASPWYIQPVVPIALTLLFGGLARTGRAGAATAIWLVWWLVYILSATYWAKLIPLYGGYPDPGKTLLRPLLRWYANLTAVADTLSLTVMTGAYPVLGMAAAAAVASVALAAVLSVRLWAARGNGMPHAK